MQDTRFIYKNQLLSCVPAINKWNLTIPLILAPLKIKYLSINLTICVQDPYEENYKTAMKEIKEPNKFRDSACSWIGRLHIIRMSIHPIMIYRFSAIQIKNLVWTSFLMGIDKLILKFIWRNETQESEHNTEEEQNWRTDITWLHDLLTELQ